MNAFFHNDIFLLEILYIHSASPNLKPFISRALLKTEHHQGAPRCTCCADTFTFMDNRYVPMPDLYGLL